MNIMTEFDFPSFAPGLSLDVGDRLVHILAKFSDPTIVVFSGLLDNSECDALISLAKPRMTRSMTINSDVVGGSKFHTDRTSNGMFFIRGENDVVKRLELRISRLLNWPVNHGEGLQILQYQAGAEYKPHYDYFNPVSLSTPDILKRGGQRIATVIVYLSDPEDGGYTIFPDINFKVSPKRGNAVFFSYPVPAPSSRTLHGGEPVISGEKWIATKWLRTNVFT